MLQLKNVSKIHTNGIRHTKAIEDLTLSIQEGEFVALVGPAIEEVFFRGFTYTAFRNRWGVRWAIVGSAALFALLHMNLIAFIPIFILGVFLAYLYEKTGSLVPSMTVHMTHNFLMVNAALFFKGIAS